MKKNHTTIVTKKELTNIFLNLGISQSSSIMIHGSLGKLGYLVNGPEDVIDALLEIVGSDGNLLFPSHTRQYTDPADWRDPPVPSSWVKKIRQNMNPFDPKKSPINNRGILGDTFLRYPGVERSYHPLNSTAAIGKDAVYFTNEHPIHASEGENSPCHKLYKKDGYVLLLGVTLEAATVIHTAEFLADVPYLKKSNVKILLPIKGVNKFVRMKKYPGTSKHFEKLRPLLKDKNALWEYDFFGYKITYFSVQEAINLSLEKIKEDQNYLINSLENN